MSSRTTKRVPVYNYGGTPTSTEVRVKNDGVVYKQDVKKFNDVGPKPPPSEIPQEHRAKLPPK